MNKYTEEIWTGLSIQFKYGHFIIGVDKLSVHISRMNTYKDHRLAFEIISYAAIRL
ncbi:MAG: hypothetical protein JKX81_19680 [Arenicella sp.]|nr:hypothetical protein [Arenicella sp.]